LSADERAAAKQNTERDGERREHVVRSGESLWSISQRYSVGVRALASWNAMAPGDVLSVGRKLVVWTAAPATAAATAVAQATASAAATIPVSFDKERLQRVTYTVRRGDSLSTIARRFRVTVGKLIEWNGVSTEKFLQPGQRLVIHVDVTKQSG
jgi:membrane-bound lytic murein transglycosylase D